MASLYSRVLPWILLVRGQVGAGSVSLVLGVMVSWLVIFGAVAFTVPTPATPAHAPPRTIVEGDIATIQAPPLEAWPIPIDRTTYDDYHRAFLDDDEGAMMEALSRPGWIPVADRQAVRLVLVDRDAAQVEVLDGPHAGSRGWLKTRQLRP